LPGKEKVNSANSESNNAERKKQKIIIT